MAYIMVDIESDGPIPGDYSMISFGAVSVDEPPKVMIDFAEWIKATCRDSPIFISDTNGFD